MTHVCVSKLTIIGSDNGLAPGRRQPIIWTNAGILLIRTNFSEILSEIRAFSFKKMHLKMSSAKWRPFCLGLNMLIITDFGSMRCLNPYIQSDNSSSSWCYLLYLYPTLNKIYLILSYLILYSPMFLMMTSPNGTIFHVTGPLCGEFTGHRWIPLTKASDAELSCFLWSVPEKTGWANHRDLVIWGANALVVMSL